MRKRTVKKIHGESARARQGFDGLLHRGGIVGLAVIGLLFVFAISAVYCLAPEMALAAGGGVVAFGTTLAANKNRSLENGTGPINEIPVIASDIIYEGAAVGDNGAGYARPLVAGDKFLGFAESKVDNSSGSAGDLNVRVHTRGFTSCAISGAVITDIGQPVYASDDNAFVFTAVSNSIIGRVYRFVSSGVAIVEFTAGAVDPFGGSDVRETKSANYTIDALDGGKIIYVDTDAKIMTLPATDAGLTVTFVNAGAFGAVFMKIAPNSSDQINGVDFTAVDNKFIANTKATARRGDYVTLVADGTDGWFVTAIKGVWEYE